MADISRAQTVQELLQNLKGTDPLKRLFWTELNYERVNKTLPRQSWPDAAAGALAEDSVLFAKGGEQFEVIYSRLNTDKLLLGSERLVITRLLQNHPYALFVFSNAKQDHWHFVNVKYEDEVQRRRMFRRFTIGPEERLRTAAERLDMINLADATNLAPNTIQQLHDLAFDVEPVTKEFFQEYRRVFEEVEESIKGIGDKEQKRLFTQRLFNRIMFIAFIQKKGWLKFGGSTDYLNALWKAYKADKTLSDNNFYRDRLKPLFFMGLNSSNEINIIGINRGAGLAKVIGEVPYLNGGLFEEDEDDKNSKIIVTDKAIDAVLNDLFARFNFTVTESTPLDVEVAVDPEMLGKIFEELVTGRHETGSYYTPKQIVSFMCRGALKDYLGAEVPTEAKEAVEQFVDEHKPGTLRNAEAVLEALRRIRVCDPACGSGAYLVGMQHELLDLRESLFATAKLDTQSVYGRKLEIIQNNLYGVDLDPFAVNIARLRLWLSLSVDFEGDSPPPLPNLDYKLETGDSLICPSADTTQQLALQTKVVQEYVKCKREFLMAHHSQKIDLRAKIDTLKTDLRSWAHSGATGFDWLIDFTEVFLNGGFDVVVGNPPYVSSATSDKVEGLRDELRRRFQTAVGAFDVFVPFYELSARIVKPGGSVTLITPNKVLSAEYAIALRKFLIKNCRIESLLDASRAKPFGAAVYPIVLSFTRNSGLTAHDVRFFRAFRDGSDFQIQEYSPRPAGLLAEFEGNWTPLSYEGCEALLPILREKATFSSVATVKGAASVSEAYEIKEIIQEGSATATQGRFLVSGNISRYSNSWGSYRTQYIKSQYQNPILPLDDTVLSKTRVREITCPKIIASGMAKNPKAFFDESGQYAGAKSTVLIYDSAVDLAFLCGLLNSRLYAVLYKFLFESLALSGGYMRFGPPQIGRLPVKAVPPGQIKRIGDAVRKLQRAKEANKCKELDDFIDSEVLSLYGISASVLTNLEIEIKTREAEGREN